MKGKVICEEIERHATEYLERALPAEVHLRLEGHVRMCATCRTELRRIRRTVETLGSLPRERMPPAMKRRLLRIARQHPTAPSRASARPDLARNHAG